MPHEPHELELTDEEPDLELDTPEVTIPHGPSQPGAAFADSPATMAAMERRDRAAKLDKAQSALTMFGAVASGGAPLLHIALGGGLATLPALPSLALLALAAAGGVLAYSPTRRRVASLMLGIAALCVTAAGMWSGIPMTVVAAGFVGALGFLAAWTLPSAMSNGRAT